VLALTEGVIKAMLLSKLKTTVFAGTMMLLAGVGASGLTYRATAQGPVSGVALASRPQADELESLRLELEALRKSLQAIRERVKMLEEEVRTMKRAERNPPQMKMRDTMKGASSPLNALVARCKRPLQRIRHHPHLLRSLARLPPIPLPAPPRQRHLITHSRAATSQSLQLMLSPCAEKRPITCCPMPKKR
jgi:hypothetical protein